MRPYLKEAVWGGKRLAEDYRKGDNELLAETWELSDYEGACSYASGGEYDGLSFGELHKLFAPTSSAVLIKFIDSDGDLSIQVHPSYPKENAMPKNECWYILHAEKGARIAYGLKDNYKSDELRLAAENGTLCEYLNYVEVKAGDFFYVPAGLIHAIGAGITLVEVQETSDTTYRLYDYGRIDKNGNARELHLDEGLKVYRHFSEQEIRDLRFEREYKIEQAECLTSCMYFTVLRLNGQTDISRLASRESALVFLSSGRILTGEETIKVNMGETYYIPPMTECVAEAENALLVLF